MSEMDSAALVVLIIKKKPVHLDSLLSHVKLDNPEWIWSCATLHCALQHQTLRYAVHTDARGPCQWAWYLKYFFDYTEQGRPFVFMDESWLNN